MLPRPGWNSSSLSQTEVTSLSLAAASILSIISNKLDGLSPPREPRAFIIPTLFRRDTRR